MLLLAIVAASGCAASAPPNETAPRATASALPAAAPGLVVVAMKADFGHHKIELTSGGAFVFDGEMLGTVTGMEVRDPSGAPIVTVASDGSLTVKQKSVPARFDAHDTLEMDGTKMSIADDGTVTFIDKEGKPDPANVRFVGFVPAARRTALLLIVAAHAVR
jgi:hypothetical protein